MPSKSFNRFNTPGREKVYMSRLSCMVTLASLTFSDSRHKLTFIYTKPSTLMPYRLPLFTALLYIVKRAVAMGCMAACLSSCASSAPAFGERGYTESGQASYYARKFQGRTMANGEKYRRGKLTAAHRTLPLGTKVKVTNTRTNKSVKVHITDRGPFIKGRIVDLSEKAARRLNFIKTGVIPVELKVIQPAAAR